MNAIKISFLVRARATAITCISPSYLLKLNVLLSPENHYNMTHLVSETYSLTHESDLDI